MGSEESKAADSHSDQAQEEGTAEDAGDDAGDEFLVFHMGTPLCKMILVYMFAGFMQY